MNQRNLEYLKNQLKETGFGQQLHGQLEDNIQKRLAEFTLRDQRTFDRDELICSLHFKRSPDSDLYFFSSFLSSLKKQGQGQKINQSFAIASPYGITLKEAFNLMDGRAVNKNLTDKDGKIYNAWLGLDFKNVDANGNYKVRQFDQNHGFDLEKSLLRLSIKELTQPVEKERLLASLRKGNRQEVKLMEGASELKVFIEANPEFRAIIITDGRARKLSQHLSSSRQTIQSAHHSISGQKQSGIKPQRKKGLSINS